HAIKQNAELGVAAAVKVHDGEPILLLGYPGGVELLTSRVPVNAVADLYKFGRPSIDETAAWLAKHKFIEPIPMQTRINSHTDDRIFFEAPPAGGTTGGPVLNVNGQVVGMHLAVHNSQPSFNMATSLAPIATWIKEVASN